MQPQIGTDWSPVGQIYFFTLHSTNPKYDVMELKSLEDWVIEKQFKSVPNVVDVASFGGPTREYQVRVDPEQADRLRAQPRPGGTAAHRTTTPTAAEASSKRVCSRSTCATSVWSNVRDIEDTVITTKNGTPLRVRDIAIVQQGPKIRLGQFAKAIHREDGKIIDNDDVVSGIVLLRKGADSDSTLEGIHAKVKELNEHILPPGVKVVPFLDRSDLVHYTTHTVVHNLAEGIMLVAVILFLFLGNLRGALIVALTIPFSLLFASICLDLRKIPANLLVSGRAGFRHGRGWRGGDGREHRPASGTAQTIARRRREQKIFEAAHEVQRPVFYAIGIIITAYIPIFTLQRVEGRLFKPMAWTVAFALLGRADFLDDSGAGAGQLPVPQRRARNGTTR